MGKLSGSSSVVRRRQGAERLIEAVERAHTLRGTEKACFEPKGYGEGIFRVCGWSVRVKSVEVQACRRSV